MARNKMVEYVFFYGLLVSVTFLVWKIIAPFAGALALSAIVVTIVFPLHEWVLRHIGKKHKSLAAFLSVLLVLIVVVVPLALLGSVLLGEAQSIYQLVNSGSQSALAKGLSNTELFVQRFVPEFTLDITSHVGRLANFVASNIGAIFTGTAATIFLFLVSLIGAFYFFRDGKQFTTYLIQLSPLPDKDDEKIVRQLAKSIRAVALGTVLIAIIQGTLTAIGLSLFGFERAILWGSVAAIGALIPGIGTSIVFIPAIIYSVFTGSYVVAAGVALWGAIGVGLIDNFLGPYLMSRGTTMHPLLVLLSVLGGIVLFGPIGFILGPVAVTLLLVLLQLYSVHISKTSK